MSETNEQRLDWAVLEARGFPGDYLCKCHVCERHFVGPKRALTCRECAGNTTPAVATTPSDRLRNEMHTSVCELVRYREQRPNDYAVRLGMVVDYLHAIATEEGSRTSADTREAALLRPAPLQSPDTSSLKGLIGRATPGPWEAQRYDESEEGLSIIAVIPGQETPTRGQVAWLGTIAGASFARPELCQANAELICKAVNALPWLIARSEQADRLEGALRAYHLATFAVIGEGGRRSWSVNPVALAKAYDLAAPLLSTLPPSQEEGE